MKTTYKLLLTTALTALAWQANAASVSLLPASAEVDAGGTPFSIALDLDAADAPGAHPGAFSGIVAITYNVTQVLFQGFEFIGPAAELAAPDVTLAGDTATLTLGFYNAIDVGTIGNLSFSAIAPAGEIISFGLADSDDFFGSFISGQPSNQRFFPEFNGTEVLSVTTVVPLPATAWLMMSGLGLLYSLRRRGTT